MTFDVPRWMRAAEESFELHDRGSERLLALSEACSSQPGVVDNLVRRR